MAIENLSIGNKYFLFWRVLIVLKKQGGSSLIMSNTHATPILAEQYLCEHISKATGQSKGAKAIQTEADGPLRQQVKDYRVGIMQGRNQVLIEKGENKGNTSSM